MINASRRGVLAMGVVAAILSACTPSSTDGGGSPGITANGNYGDDPRKPGPGALVADYYSLVILRLNKDLKWEASHGSFNSPSKDNEGEVRRALLAQLEGLAPNGDVQSLNPLPNSAGYNFENWGFGSSRRVYIYVDNPTVRFAKLDPLTFKSQSSLALIDEEASRARKINPNKSFYGAKSDDKFARGSLLYFENYFRTPDGKPIPVPATDKQYYSLSFNLLMDMQTGTKPLPVIVDPDTGNGMGWPPP